MEKNGVEVLPKNVVAAQHSNSGMYLAWKLGIRNLGLCMKSLSPECEKEL